MIKSAFDLIDLMGPDATKEDYQSLVDIAQEIITDPEMWGGEET